MKKKSLSLLSGILLFGSSQLMAQWSTLGNSGTTLPANFVGTTDNVGLAFRTNNQEWMRIGNAGRVGINTVNPNARLHVYHKSTATDPQLLLEDSIGYARINFKNKTTANYFAVAGLPAPGATAAKLNFFYSPAGNIMTLQGDGKVGIGVVAPTDRLHINSPAGTNALKVDVAGATKLWVNSNGGVSVGSATTPQANGLFVTGNLEVAGGQVNIGSVENLEDAGDWTISSNSHFIPTTACVRDLGTPDIPWRNLYLCGSVVNTSDGRLKENVQNLGYGLSEILKLRPVTYNWINNQDRKKNIGLIAQEVQTVLPEMVSESRVIFDEHTGKANKVASSRLGIEYNAFIPVLVKAIQEQQTAMESKDKQLSDLQSRFDQLQNALVKKGVIAGNETGSTSAKSEIISESAGDVQLYQNAPNPFDKNTTIGYKIPAGAKAQIMISDLTGKTVKTLRAPASGQVQINAYDLQAGTYVYSLVVNGKIEKSNKMVVLK